MNDATGDRWIVIPNWNKFQHYQNRDPGWVKTYTSLLHKDEYLALTGHQRAVLHGIWLEYASAHRRLRLDTASLTRQLALRVTSHTIETLTHAGFIEVSSSPTRAREEAEADADLVATQQADSQNGLPARNETPDTTLEAKLLRAVRDRTPRTEAAIHGFALRLPDAALATTLESLTHRRTKQPALTSEARYVVATLASIEREGQQ